MRAKDRLPDLRRGDAECAPPPPPAPAPHLHHIHELLHEVERALSWTAELQENTRRLRRLHADPTFHNNTQLQEQLEALTAASSALGVRVCGALRALEERARRAAPGSAGARIARLQCACTRARLAAALHEHHAALGEVRGARRALLRDQLALTELALGEEECEALLDTRAPDLFAGDVRGLTAEARRALREAEARHEELARVEAALRDVRDMFQQLAALVAAQQDSIDSVEYFALQATDHVGSGQRHLLKGTVSRTKTRKKKLSVILCVAAGVSVVLLVLVLT